jgi:GMP synthase (glutamine-hydrolysing)
MRKLYIIKTGTTFPDVLQRHGDFDQWTATALGSPTVPLETVDVENGQPLPPPDQCAGAIVTGSHAMVTDRLPWSVLLEEWTRELLNKSVPFYGICYGHQVLAHAAGGKVDYHPNGEEIGTVPIETHPVAFDDPVFCDLPKTFNAHVTHSQSVLELPEGAIHLASNPFEPRHAFRIGQCAWSVQFHPEYSVPIMQLYIRKQAEKLKKKGRDIEELLAAVQSTPDATRTLTNFARLAAERS